MTGRKKTLKKKQFKCFCPTHVCTTPVVQEMTSAPHRSPPLPLLAPLLPTVWHCQGCRYLHHNHNHFCCYCYLFLVDCCLPLHCLCFHHHCLPPLLPLLAANTVATVSAAANRCTLILLLPPLPLSGLLPSPLSLLRLPLTWLTIALATALGWQCRQTFFQLHPSNDRHFCLSSTCWKCPNTLATF
jgi:hypothetical protein